MSDPVTNFMNDPITGSIEIGISAIKAAATLGTWWEVRKSLKKDRSSGVTETGSRSGPSLDDLLFVLANLGQRLLALDVINYDVLPQAHAAVMAATTAADSDVTISIEEMDPILQYLVTCAFVFCAACHPMPIYYGYGCGVMNDPGWASPETTSFWMDDIDNAISYLKSVPHPWKLFKKSPSGISKTTPWYHSRDKKILKEMKSLYTEFVKQYEKVGYPQPLPPNDNIKINMWSIPFATFGGKYIYYDCGHDFMEAKAYQLDPGRFMYAWTIGEHGNLRPGEAVVLHDDHIGELAKWLEGLSGITFKVLLDSDLDWSKITLKSSTKKLLKAHSGNEYGIGGLPDVIVLNPNPAALVSEPLDHLHIVTMAVPLPATKVKALPEASPEPASPSKDQANGMASSPLTDPSETASESSKFPAPITTSSGKDPTVELKHPEPMSPQSTTSTFVVSEPATPSQEFVSPLAKTPVAVMTAAGNTPTVSTAPSFTSSSNLPPGWELRLTPEGRVYYVNHVMQTTSWEPPPPMPISSGLPSYQTATAQISQPQQSEVEMGPSGLTKSASIAKRKPLPQRMSSSSQDFPAAQMGADRELVSPNSEKSFVYLSKEQSFTTEHPYQASAPEPEVARVKIELPPQEPRNLLNFRTFEGKKKNPFFWTADMPVTPDLYQQLESRQHEYTHIRHSACTGEPEDMLKLNYNLRPAGPTELLVVINVYYAGFEREALNSELITTLGSVMDELSGHTWMNDFKVKCNDDPLSGIVVCIHIQHYRVKQVPWLRQMGFSFLWDLPSSVKISDSKKETKLYDDAHKDTRKILGKEVKTFLNEYTTTFRLQDWGDDKNLMPDIVSGRAPMRIILCSTNNPWTKATDDWAKSIGKLLDARLCIDVPGGTTVKAATIEKQWKLSQYRPKPSESGEDTYYEKYLP